MKEVYDEYCIPVFGAPLTSMGHSNKYSCDFLNVSSASFVHPQVYHFRCLVQVGATNTSYVVLHADRPPHTPECCIIGQPFHGPPQDFAKLMPVHWTDKVGDIEVDWNAVYDKLVIHNFESDETYDECVFFYIYRDAGIFSYGFRTDSESVPFAFYMKVYIAHLFFAHTQSSNIDTIFLKPFLLGCSMDC